MKTLKYYIRKSIPGTVALATLGLFSTVAPAATVDAIYSGPTDVPVTADSYTATGNTVNFTLNFTPPMATELVVVRNTGLAFIGGTFDNLTNGQPVTFSNGGSNYNFVANYYGGSGNDLVLVWANQRAFAWGQTSYGQLGDSTITNRLLPVPVTTTGVLAGKTLVAVAAGTSHSLALCSDGTVAAWGINNGGQLGDNTFMTTRSVPVMVNTDPGVSALFGKTVVSLAAGLYHSLALCSDGTVAAWGDNSYGKLGDNTTASRLVPVAVNTASGISALYGKTVVGIAAGPTHSLALCSDGTVVAWGSNAYGQLGDNTTTQRNVPVAVNTDSGVSVLYGKTVTAIAAGNSHSLALCSDGTVAAWGYNASGKLGDNTTTQRNAPVAVNTDSGVSALFGKTVVSIAAGGDHCLALCSDDTVAAWGSNGYGQLGDNTTTQRNVPVAVNTNSGVSALYGRTVVGLAAGYFHCSALCSDGTVVAWGYNSYGELGDNTTTNRLVPVAVNATGLAGGELFTRVARSSTAYHSLALAAMPCAPTISLSGNGVTITNGARTPNLADGTDFGTTMAGGGTVVRTFTIQNTGPAPLNLTGLPKVVVSGPQAADFTVTLQPTSPLMSLTGATTFQVTFAPSAIGMRWATLTITNDDANGNPFTFAVQGGGAGALAATYTTGHEMPLTTSGFTATGSTVSFTLNCTPVTGAELMVVQNTGLGFIHGTFDNLTNGQPVILSYGGAIYNFVANYYGGSGNDLVLVWANNRAFAWGQNTRNQLGDSTTTNRLLPVPVTATGVLAGKTLVTVAAGNSHSLALCSDGTMVAWGYNNFGQVGDNTLAPRSVPVAVNTAAGVSALNGKTVVAIAAGLYHSVALCSDGTVAGWGQNTGGQLGDNTTTGRLVPVAVNRDSGTSALYGKTVVAIAAGGSHSLALCSDGTVAAWGGNLNGQLGDNTTTQRLVPVAVNMASGISALYGKTVVAIAAGQSHSLALCSDGTVVAWGYNSSGQLGDNTTTQRLVPVAVNTNSGISALYGETVVGIAAGATHSLVLCSDGTVAVWGSNIYGQLGDNTTTMRKAPVAVNTNSGVSALYGKTVVGLGAGYSHSFVLCSDGTMAAWGYNADGELGDNTTTQRNVPVAVNTTRLAAGELFTCVARSSTADHTLALAAMPCLPAISLFGNGVAITNGAGTPNLADGTDFGGIMPGGGTVVRTFTIQNTGPAPLNLTGSPRVAVSGPQAAQFTVTQQPASPVASLTGVATFQVSFAAGAMDTYSATLSITNDDADQTPFTFAVQGHGVGTVEASYTTGNEVPLTTSGFTATGSTVSFTLNFAPPVGTELMVVNNTGLDFIHGTFDNLTNGQPVALSYGGVTYNFVANYYGGSGNDLVLVWANNRAFAWGDNSGGEIGDNTTANRFLPVPVTTAGVLAGKTVIAIAANGSPPSAGHSLALCSDGTLAAWGGNGYGELGDNSTTSRLMPVAVNTASGISALYSKRVVAIAAGNGHSLALCSDGTVAAWGRNAYGALGDNTTTTRKVPVAVNTASGVSALNGKTVVAISAGEDFSLALCSDGTVAAWGYNSYGALGDNTTTTRKVPVAVNTAAGVSALYGKTVAAISAGGLHNLALCSDGTVAAWGNNSAGGLGDNTTTTRAVPVAVNTDSGVSALYGKTVMAIAAGYMHSLALCSDGTLAAWGWNFAGQLGDNTKTDRLVPVIVNTNSGVSALYGKTVVAIGGGCYHSVALCSDNMAVAWGHNMWGQLGDNTTTNRLVPVAVDTAPLAASQRFIRVTSGNSAPHTMALVAAPPAVEITLTGAQALTGCPFQFCFTNTPGACFSVLATTNPALPLCNWTPLGDATEVSAGQFQFTDPQATNGPQRFYRVHSP